MEPFIKDVDSPRSGEKGPVRVGRARVGRGVFARKRFRVSELIGEICGEIIDDPDYGSSYCFSLENGRHLEPVTPFRFVNHSCEPNCEFRYLDESQDGVAKGIRRIMLFALSEIKPGVELTLDYNWDAESAIRCCCGAPNCRGWVVAAGELAKITHASRTAM